MFQFSLCYRPSHVDPIRGVYLATVFYHKENILVTAEDQIPLVEIHCCSTSITHDFPWFAKVNCHSNARIRRINISAVLVTCESV